jgi:hypothetical protein
MDLEDETMKRVVRSVGSKLSEFQSVTVNIPSLRGHQHNQWAVTSYVPFLRNLRFGPFTVL